MLLLLLKIKEFSGWLILFLFLFDLIWFVAAFMPRIKTGRSFKVETLCDFSQADQLHKVIIDFIIFLYIISIYFIDLFAIVNLI
jgi:hypothetical protein